MRACALLERVHEYHFEGLGYTGNIESFAASLSVQYLSAYSFGSCLCFSEYLLSGPDFLDRVVPKLASCIALLYSLAMSNPLPLWAVELNTISHYAFVT
jgi:hypothetical protein